MCGKYVFRALYCHYNRESSVRWHWKCTSSQCACQLLTIFKKSEMANLTRDFQESQIFPTFCCYSTRGKSEVGKNNFRKPSYSNRPKNSPKTGAKLRKRLLLFTYNLEIWCVEHLQLNTAPASPSLVCLGVRVNSTIHGFNWNFTWSKSAAFKLNLTWLPPSAVLDSLLCKSTS